jgi:hypothetical protein
MEYHIKGQLAGCKKYGMEGRRTFSKVAEDLKSKNIKSKKIIYLLHRRE